MVTPAALSLSLLLGSLAAAQTTNMIRNPGFEEGADQPAEWHLGMEGRGAGSATWVTDNPRSGKRCVRLELTEPGDYWMAQQRYAAGTALPDHPYRVSGWYRSTTSACHPCLYFLGRDGSFLGAWETALPASEEWKPFDFVIQSKAGTDHFELQLRVQSAPGVCWFDDMALEDAAELVRRGDELMAPLLKTAEAQPEHLWVVVSNGGRAEIDLVGNPALSVAWVVADTPGDAPLRDYGIRVERLDRAGVVDSKVVRRPAGAGRHLETFAPAPAGRRVTRTRLTAFSDNAGPRPVLLVGLRADGVRARADGEVAASLAGLVSFPLSKGDSPLSLPWETQVLPATRARFAVLRDQHCNDVLRKALGATGDAPAAVVASAWRNLTSEQWTDWLLTQGGEPTPSPLTAAARNEYLSLQVLFAPPGRPAAVTAELSDLRGPNGTTIPASACRVRLLEYVPFGDQWLPDPLLEEQPFKPSEHGPIVFWLTIRVPGNAKPGSYRGTLTMRADNGPPTARDFALRVWDLTLPTETHLQSSFWLFRAQLNRYFELAGDVSMEDYYPYIDLATSHRLSPVDVVEGPTQPMVKVYRESDGSLSYDFAYWDQYLDRLKAGGANTIHLGFTHWMAHYFCGANPPILDRKSGKASYLDYEFGSKEHLDALGNYLRAAADHLRARGEFGKCYLQPWDEPNGDGLVKSHLILRGIKERVPDIPRLMDAVYPDTFDGKMKEVTNLWCPLSPGVEQHDFGPLRERGDTIWWYVCCGPRQPYANLFTNWKVPEMRALFWQTWQHRITGVLYWGLNYWISWDAPVPPPEKRFPNGPWFATTDNLGAGYAGDGYFIYPGTAVDKPLSSLRLETIRDGIEDYELLYLLDSLVEAKPNADLGLLAQAREVLKVRPAVSKSLREFDRTGEAMEAERAVIAALIEKLAK